MKILLANQSSQAELLDRKKEHVYYAVNVLTNFQLHFFI